MGDYIPSQVGPTDRKVFEDNVRQEVDFQNAECLSRRVQGLELRPWQEEAVKSAEEVEGDERECYGLSIMMEDKGNQNSANTRSITKTHRRSAKTRH